MMEKCKWSFQLLLEVFCAHTIDLENDKMTSPIISNVILRDELVEYEFPFIYSYVMNDVHRETDTGVFTQTTDGILFEFSDDKLHLSEIDIGTIITRHQLLHC